MALLKHLLGRAIFPARYAWFLEGRWRRLVLSPERLQQRLPLSPELTVLEIGAGGGYYAQPLSRLVRRFIALDLQAAMLRRLRQKAVGGHLLLVQADATELPVAERSIDLVLAITVLGEVPSAESTVAEVRRVLRPGGVFVTQQVDGRDFEIGRLKAKVGDLTMAHELLEVKIDHLEAGRPFAPRRRSG